MLKLTFYFAVLMVALLVSVIVPANAEADVVRFELNNVVFDTGDQMLGQFTWTYLPGDFADGSGEIMSLSIPFTAHDHNDLVVTIEPKQIEVSFDGNVHDDGVDITLSLVEPFSLNGSASLDLDPAESKYSIGGNGFHDGDFISGEISVVAVPEPTALVLIAGVAIIGGCIRRRNW